LKKLFRRVLVSEAVYQEITARGKLGNERILKSGFIHVKKIRDNALVFLLEEFIDKGKAEVITLALKVNTNILLVNDREARSLIKKLGLQVMGTLGVIALARYRGLIQEAKPIIDKLVKSNFWISRRILKEFLRELSTHLSSS